MQKITPFLWFDNNAEEAMNFYVSVFEDSRIVHIQRYPEGSQEDHLKGMDGKVLTGIFELNGQRFMALDGGPVFEFNEAVSFLVECEGQSEIDYYWGKLSAVPESERCGWCKDRYGLSWQIVPKNTAELLQRPNAVHAMLQMKKIDIAALEAAGTRA